MQNKTMIAGIGILLCACILFAGCTTQPATTAVTTTAPTSVAVPPTTQTAAPTTAALTPQATSTVSKTPTQITKVILNEKGNVSPTTFKTYDFQAMGDEFSQIGVVYKIDIKSDTPVLGYAVTSDKAAVLQSNEMTPSYTPYSEKVQWGLVTPYMVMEKVIDNGKSFTIDKIGHYVYVVDGRWMATDMKYNATPAANYQITITKIYTPSTTPLVATS